MTIEVALPATLDVEATALAPMLASFGIDAVDLDMLKRGDMLGPLLGAKLFAALSATRTAVKPLEWRPYRNGDADAVTPFGVVYSAYASGHWRTNKDPKFKKGGADLHSAMSAAQTDHDALVFSMLISTTEGE